MQSHYGTTNSTFTYEYLFIEMKKTQVDIVEPHPCALRPFLTVQQNKNKTVLLFCFVYVLSDLSCTSPPVADKNK